MAMISGPARADRPYRYGCRCGGTWNSDEPIPLRQSALCGPFCNTTLFALSDEAKADTYVNLKTGDNFNERDSAITDYELTGVPPKP